MTSLCLTTFVRQIAELPCRPRAFCSFPIFLCSYSFKQDGGLGKEDDKDKVPLKATLIVNNAPICHTHSLLVPFLEECWPQVLNRQGLATAVHAILVSKSP